MNNIKQFFCIKCYITRFVYLSACRSDAFQGNIYMIQVAFLSFMQLHNPPPAPFSLVEISFWLYEMFYVLAALCRTVGLLSRKMQNWLSQCKNLPKKSPMYCPFPTSIFYFIFTVLAKRHRGISKLRCKMLQPCIAAQCLTTFIVSRIKLRLGSKNQQARTTRPLAGVTWLYLLSSATQNIQCCLCSC